MLPASKNARVASPARLAASGDDSAASSRVGASTPTLIAYVQICDAGPDHPASAAELMAEARGNRLLPSEGALPLNAMFDALPQGLTVGVEAPTRELAALSSPEAARRAGDATRAFFAMREARG